MTSYEELSPEMRKQVDAVLHNAKRGPLYSIADYQIDYLREHISNCVLTCVGIAKKPTIPINKRHGKFYY